MEETTLYSYNFEIETMLIQFIALIDKCYVVRYDKDKDTGERIPKEYVRPRYEVGPKSRVTFFEVNKAKNVTYPVVVVTITSISADIDRIAAKQTDITRRYNNDVESYKRPTPIKIGVSVSIITKLQSDLYQIFSKLATQFQPYCHYSWCVPHDDDTSYEEIRNKVEWNKEFSIDSHAEKIVESDEEIYTGKLTFSIEGFLFPNKKQNRADTIRDIGTTIPYDYELLSRIDGEIDSYIPIMTSVEDAWKNPRELANSRPRILMSYLQVNDKFYFQILEGKRTSYNLKEKSYVLKLNGYNLSDASVLFVPKDEYETEETEVEIEYTNELWNVVGTTTEKPSTIKGYALNIKEQNQNNLIFDIGDINYSGEFDIIVYNKRDYDTICNSQKLTLKAI